MEKFDILNGEDAYVRTLKHVFWLIRNDIDKAHEEVRLHIEDPLPTGCTETWWRELGAVLVMSTWKAKKKILCKIFDLTYTSQQERRDTYEYTA